MAYSFNVNTSASLFVYMWEIVTQRQSDMLFKTVIFKYMYIVTEKSCNPFLTVLFIKK
jgi:hypothetical protein